MFKFVAPLFLLFIIIYGLIGYVPLSYEDYEYPGWANTLGWAIAGSSMMMIPFVAIFKIIITPGSFRERIITLTTCWQDKHMSIGIRGLGSGAVASEENEVHVRLTDMKDAEDV